MSKTPPLLGNKKMEAKQTTIKNTQYSESERTKNDLQNIIDSASEIIISFDKTNKIITLGKSIENFTGFKHKQFIGKNIKKVNIFDNPQEIIENLENIKQDKPPKSNIFVLNTKNGSKRIIKASFSPIKKDDSYDGAILIGEDITLEIESHGRFIDGYSYYSVDGKNEPLLNIFKNIVGVYNKKGLYITRSKPVFNNGVSEKIKTMILKHYSAKSYNNDLQLNKIVNKIKNFVEQNKGSVVLLDRVDYLISIFSFDEFMKNLYRITDIISENNSIFLLHANPCFFDLRQLSLIKSELLSIPFQELEHIKIKDDYYEILKIVNKYNQNNILVEFKKISDELSINRKTLSKKINYLEKQGLIIVRSYGRSKTPYLTEKAKAILSKNI